MTSITPITKVGSTDISAYVEYGPTKSKGGDRIIKSEPIIGTNRAVFWEEGRKPVRWDLGLLFPPTLADQIGDIDDVTALIDDLAGDQDTDLFYPGRDDRFAVVKKASVHDPSSRRGAGSAIVRKDAEFWADAAELYAATPSSWSPSDEDLPITQASGFENAGNLEAGLYSLALTARMSGTALEFDGTDDCVDCGTVDIAGNALSIAFHLAGVNAGAGKFPGIIEHGDWTTDVGAFLIQMISGGTNLEIVLGTGAGYQVAAEVPAIGEGERWLVVTFNVTTNTIIVYLDGEVHGTYTPPTPMGAFIEAAMVLNARTLSGAYYRSGIMYDFRVWTRVLSAAEAEDYCDGEAVDDTSLVIEYDFCEGQGATVYDLSGNSNDGTLTNFADTTTGAGDDGSGWLSNIGPVSPALQLLDEDDGDAQVASLQLVSSLMTAEVLGMDRFGQITQTYQDNFSADVGRPAFGNGYFPADGYAYAKYIDSEIVLTSLISGRVGEEISITIADTDQASTTVSVSGYDITVDLETSGGSPVATAQEVIDAINADEDASDLVVATLASGEDGTTVLDTQAKTQLALNVNVTGGALVIEDDREAEYHLPGVFPIVASGLVVTFTPTLTGTLTGSDVLALGASADSGATWETVIDSADEDWTDGEEMEVYVPDNIAMGQTEVWIRFVCPTSATSLSIDDLAIYQERHVPISSVPTIPVGATYKTQIGGTGQCNAVAVWRNRFKP